MPVKEANRHVIMKPGPPDKPGSVVGVIVYGAGLNINGWEKFYRDKGFAVWRYPGKGYAELRIPENETT